MTTRASAVLSDALALSDQERAEVIDALVDSLQDSFAPGVEEAWRREVIDRVAAFQAEPEKSTPWDEIRDRFRARLGGFAAG